MFYTASVSLELLKWCHFQKAKYINDNTNTTAKLTNMNMNLIMRQKRTSSNSISAVVELVIKQTR